MKVSDRLGPFPYCIKSIDPRLLPLLVGRVLWFRQEAKVARWSEEIQLVEKEIQRSKLFFRDRAALWRSKVKVDVKMANMATFGRNAYCMKRAAVYDRLLGMFDKYELGMAFFTNGTYR